VEYLHQCVVVAFGGVPVWGPLLSLLLQCRDCDWGLKLGTRNLERENNIISEKEREKGPTYSKRDREKMRKREREEERKTRNLKVRLSI
jgi:hypothetical protein